MMTTWFTFFRGPGRFNDILAIVWHVIVKFLCRTWREHSEPAWRGNSQWLETWKRQPQHTGAQGGRRKKKIIMMEENDMHRSPRSEWESDLELDKNCPLLTVLTMSDLNNTDGGFEMKIKYCTKIITTWHPHYLQWHLLCCQADIHIIPQAFVRTRGQGDRTKTVHNPHKLTQSIFIVRFRFLS